MKQLGFIICVLACASHRCARRHRGAACCRVTWRQARGHRSVDACCRRDVLRRMTR